MPYQTKAAKKTAIITMEVESCSTVYSQTLAPKPTAMNTSDNTINMFLNFSNCQLLIINCEL